MRERVTSLFQNLPPEGIALHGTNLARAKSIIEEGLRADRIQNEDPTGSIWYIVLPPRFDTNLKKEHFDIMRYYINVIADNAKKASITNHYKYGDYYESEIPAAVLFLPPSIPLLLQDRSLPYLTSSRTPIPKENILGNFTIEDNEPPQKQILRNVLTMINTDH